jgi:hypothetical protein
MSAWSDAVGILNDLAEAQCVDPDNAKIVQGLAVIGVATLAVAEEVRILREMLAVIAAHAAGLAWEWKGSAKRVNQILDALRPYLQVPREPEKPPEQGPYR